MAYLEAYAEVVRANPRSRAYLIAFSSLGHDKPGLTRRMLLIEKNFLVKELGSKPSRIKTINGGVRVWRTMELWIAPSGDYTPAITTYGISRRRGKP